MSDYQTLFKIKAHIRYYERRIEFLRRLTTLERVVVLFGAGSAVFALKEVLPNDVGFVASLVAGTLTILIAGLRIEDQLERSNEFLTRWRHVHHLADRYYVEQKPFDNTIIDAVAEAGNGAETPLRNLLLLAENDIFAAEDFDKRIVVPFWSRIFAPVYDLSDGEPTIITVKPLWANEVKVTKQADATTQPSTPLATS